MQFDIANAYIIGDIEKVAFLQNKLVTSFAARALAVRQVTSNSGKNTPGVDGVIWSTNEDKIIAIEQLKLLNGYKAIPVRRVYIPKPGKDEMRPLGIPTMFDRAVQALFLIALIPISECHADKRSFGFRPFRSTKDAITYIWIVTASKFGGYRWVLEGDIEKCFDRITHK
jgi:RNA-directed DNA polymerase